MDHPPTLLDDFRSRLNEFGGQREPCFFLIDFELRRPLIRSPEEAGAEGIRFSFPGRPDHVALPLPERSPALSFDPISPDRYRRAFDVVQDGLHRGDSFLTNLTFPTPVRVEATLEEVYAATEAKYRVLLPGGFACFSPETFVTVNAVGYLETRPMKGTAADTPDGRAWLLDDPKEIAEHATIVDLLRNDLSRVARGVHVSEYRYLQAIESQAGGLLQSSSRIGGQLPADWPGRIGDILLELLPAGSVSGAPKTATLDLIRRAEDGPRGYYCGVAGYFDGKSLDSCVLIRFLEQGPAGYTFRAGGGITARSRVGEEYAEMNAKIRLPLRKRV